jgi:ABC-type transport system involved in multi-copper enzyme maturation permease subunit
MIGRVYAVAINTFREAVRDRVLYGVLGAATAVLLFTLALAELSLNEQRRVVLDVGLASISLFSVAVAIFLGSSLLYKEIERKTLYVILPKPIHRWEFLIGKYFGIALTALVFIALMGAIQLWVTALQERGTHPLVLVVIPALLVVLAIGLFKARDRTAVLLPWSLLSLVACAGVCATSAAPFDTILAALALTAGEVLVLSAVALFFSSFSTPFLTGLFTLGVWFVGRSADNMVTMREGVVSEEVRTMLRWAAEIVPNFSLYVPGHHTLTTHSERFGGAWIYVAESLAYGFVYAAVLLVLASVIFRRRDFL